MNPAAPIQFYSTGDAYGDFSNFSPYAISLSGKRWPTSEHCFQAQKFTDAKLKEQVRRANTPALVARMGRDRKLPLRRDWNNVKLGVMRAAVQAKFTQHAELAALLLGTGEAVLIEHTENDAYWGDGGDGSGANWLGRILMDVRSHLRDQAR